MNLIRRDPEEQMTFAMRLSILASPDKQFTDGLASPLTANTNELLNQKPQNMCRGTKQYKQVPFRRQVKIFHPPGGSGAGPNVCELTPDQWRPWPSLIEKFHNAQTPLSMVVSGLFHGLGRDPER